LYSLPPQASGLAKAGVPTKSLIKPLFLNFLQVPKSIILISSLVSIRMFSGGGVVRTGCDLPGGGVVRTGCDLPGFISRCIILLL
jgi:hypothetical protein